MDSLSITKEHMKEILDESYGKKKFQNFVTVMRHAQTCKECSKFFHETMKMAEDHLALELV